jgi:phosphatidylglycerol---prolipoprotein diacylglyceryl transferase
LARLLVLWDGLHKIAFEIGPVTVTWFGILVATGFLAGLWTASRRARRVNFQPDTILDLGPWLLLGAIVGARAVFVATYWPEVFAGRPIYEIFMVQRGGIVYYGGLIGASLACIIFARLKKLPLWRLADVLAPSVALGSFFGRWGCLMNGCCYGRPTTLPWGIQFPKGHDTYPDYVHPTEIYDSLLNFALYGLLAWLYRRRKFDGQVFGVYLIGYAALRSFVEKFRGDYTQEHYWKGMTPAQLISIGICAAGILLLWIQWRHAPPAVNGGKVAVPRKA